MSNAIVRVTIWDRIGALTGLVGGIVTGLAIGFTDISGAGFEGGPEDPSALIARAYVANKDRGRSGAMLALLGAFLMIAWVSFLYSKFREAEGQVGWFSTLVLVGGILLLGVTLVEAGFAYAASELKDYGGDTQVAKVFMLWGWNSANLVAPGLGAIMAGSALLGLVKKVIPMWLGYLSAVLFVVMVLIAIVVGAPGLGAAVGSIWTLVVSIAFALGRVRLGPGISGK